MFSHLLIDTLRKYLTSAETRSPPVRLTSCTALFRRRPAVHEIPRYCRATATSSLVFGFFNLVSGNGLDRICSPAIENAKAVEKEWDRKRNISREKRPGLTHCGRALFFSPFWSNVLITDLINIPKL
ncbi:hypothetical protein EVAR_97565_1 [Eumeta japonica]|uniref:Uncharacterized protein n=1 Tax=Eumeta variegata TaxID=151549 RepID=A0A4C1WR01_EUMVA|nr:hypothetical protein EVAR_97565_1 [Eumeta japonica]